jgi:hypothetical protein
MVRAAVFAILAIAALLAVPLSSRALHASDSGAIQNLISWDLTGVSFFSGRDYRAPLHSAVPAHALDCYSPRLFGACGPVALSDSKAALRQWGEAIHDQPLAYAKHRALVLSMLLRFGCEGCSPYIWERGERDSLLSPHGRANPLRHGLGRVVRWFGGTPLGRPYFWLVAAFGLAGLLWRRARPDDATLALIAISGAVYALTYGVVAVTDEFRYLYWLIYSVVLVGSAWLFASRPRAGEAMRWIVLPLLLAVAAETLVRSARPTDHIAPSMATNY